MYANQTATVNWSTAGRIAAINVKQGDTVKAGQVLATLDPTSLTDNNVILAQQNLITAQQNMQNLKDSTVSKSNAQLALAQAQQAVTDAQTARDLLNYSRGQNGNADAASAEFYIAQNKYNLALDKFNKLANLAPTDPTNAPDVLAAVGVVKGGIGAISLVVGGIGIMNIMLVSVTERTREIGLRKALGAHKADIRLQFMIESSVLSLIGGLVGVAVAAGVSQVISNIAAASSTAINPVIGLNSVLLACLFSSAVGLFFGIYPANRDSNLEPVEALRFE